MLGQRGRQPLQRGRASATNGLSRCRLARAMLRHAAALFLFAGAAIAVAPGAAATLVCEKPINGWGACVVILDNDPNGPPICNPKGYGLANAALIGATVYTPVGTAGYCPVWV